MPGITEEWKIIRDDRMLEYFIKISGFENKMQTWRPGREVWSKVFCHGESEFCMNIYPNGNEKKNKGFISVFLINRNDWDVKVDITFHIGKQRKDGYFKILANSSRGWPQFCKHREILAETALDDEGKLTTTMLLADIWEEVICDGKVTKKLLEESKEEVEDLKSDITLLKKEMKSLNSKTESGKKDIKKMLPETQNELACLRSEVADLRDDMKTLISQFKSLGNTSNRVSTIPCPECPICFEEMKPPMHIGPNWGVRWTYLI